MKKLTKALALVLLIGALATSCGEDTLQDIAPVDLEITTNTDGDDGDSKDNPPPGAGG